MPHNPELDRVKILDAILRERELQDAVWGNQTTYTDEWWQLLITSKHGDVAHEIYRSSNKQLFRKLIEICAIYFAWAEMLSKKADGEIK